MPAFLSLPVRRFLDTETDSVVGRLTSASADVGFYQQVHSQSVAWRQQIKLLQDAIHKLALSQRIDAWHVLLEFPIPRRGKRIDCVLIAGDLLFVVEFKCGATEFALDGIVQVEDYCLDLRDFHEGSHGVAIVPVLVATDAKPRPPRTLSIDGLITGVRFATRDDLAEVLLETCKSFQERSCRDLDPIAWERSEYVPTPTIVEAARALYSGQNVREITRCHGGIENLTRTSDAVLRAIQTAKALRQKLICFVTGVPGAGKTLAGLNVVHNQAIHDGDLGVFLSGNRPLVRVLTEALARDHATRKGVAVAASRREVSTFVQPVHHFIDEYFQDGKLVPVDRVVVFDEAQRAWDAQQSKRKFNREFSEPEIMLEIMDRHQDWSVIVALIGQGQEINRGEAGLAEWGHALTRRFPHWQILASPSVVCDNDGRNTLFYDRPKDIQIEEVPSLHLEIPLRSYKATAAAEFVEAVLRLDAVAGASIFAKLDAFPIVLTRSLRQAKAWLNQRQRGSRRTGLIASSGARRLRAHGLDVTAQLDVESWFLNSRDDVRSSFFLETPATEFGIQGLELDWTGLCWGGDLYPDTDKWICRAFRRTRWQNVNDAQTQRYIVNKYRVLLTRAREGMVIWVPPGSKTDVTRPKSIYDKIASFLQSCGVPLMIADHGAGTEGDDAI